MELTDFLKFFKYGRCPKSKAYHPLSRLVIDSTGTGRGVVFVDNVLFPKIKDFVYFFGLPDKTPSLILRNL